MRTAAQNNSELHMVAKAVGYLKTHWWLLALEMIAIFGVNLYRYYQSPPVYSSGSSLLIDNSTKQMYRTYVLGNSQVKKRNMVHLLESQEVFNRFNGALWDHYNEEGRPRYLRPFFPEKRFHPNHFRAFVNLSWDSRSDIYHVSCSGPNPDAAHDVCLIYLNVIQEFYPEIGQREAMLKREFLARQIASMTREIADREGALADFQRKHTEFLDFLSEGGKDRAVRELRNIVRKLENEIEDNRSLKDLLLNVPAAKRGEHSSLRTAITALTQQLAELSYDLQLTEQSQDPGKQARLDTLNQEIARISAQLASLNEKELEVYLKNPIKMEDARQQIAKLEFDYRIKLNALRRAREELKVANEKVNRFRHLFLEYDRLTAELQHRRAMLNNLYKQEQRTEIELSAGQAEIYRLREPSRNPKRVAPQITAYIYRGLSLSLFFMGVTIVMLMALVPRLDSEAEVHRLSLPVIGKVPAMRHQGRTVDDIPSFGLEHLKIMHYRILRETKDLKCPIVIVSSPNAREGKSTVAHSLAITSQSSSRRTLLIDGDMLTLRPYKFQGIQEDQTPGLHSVLMDESPPPPDQLIVRSVVEGVSFMPRGERLDPTRLTANLRPIENYLKTLREQYDLILIDTPPLFASNLGHQWAGLADLIVLVARIYVTRPKDIIEAIQTCKVFSKAPVGIALNCVPLSAAHKRASNYYFSRKKVKSRMAA